LNPDRNWVVYLVRCNDNSLYCGITNDLQNRLRAHNCGKGAKYTRSRSPVELLGTSPEMTKSSALKLEHRIKQTPAGRKLAELEIWKGSQEVVNLQILLEIQRELLSVGKALQQITDSIGKIANATEKLTTAGSPADLPKRKAKRAPARKKVIVKDGTVEKIKRVSATQIVFDRIQNSTQGISTAELMKATGFNQKKVHNITFRLKKEGKIISEGRGVYKKV
jgi:putative endonuclease